MCLTHVAAGSTIIDYTIEVSKHSDKLFLKLLSGACCGKFLHSYSLKDVWAVSRSFISRMLETGWRWKACVGALYYCNEAKRLWVVHCPQRNILVGSPYPDLLSNLENDRFVNIAWCVGLYLWTSQLRW